jgi:hypothetical protein
MGPLGTGIGPEQKPTDGRFNKAEAGLMVLKGEVIWKNPDAPELKTAREVLVYVNGSRQFPVRLDPARGRATSRTFAAPIALTREQGNTIRIKPQLKAEQNSQTELSLDCKEPWTKHRLHILIVGIDVEDPRTLRDSLFLALGAELPRGKEGRFKTPLFDHGILYTMLSGPDLEAGEIRGGIDSIRSKILELRNTERWMNDLIIIYYQGVVEVDARGDRYLHTRKSLRLGNDLGEALALKSLPPMPGIQLLLLNVNRKTATVEPGAEDKARPENVAVIANVGAKEKELGNPKPPFLTRLREALRDARSGQLGDTSDNLRKLFASDTKALEEQVPSNLRPTPLQPPMR